MDGRADTILEFGEFRFAPESRRLWRGEELMLLAPKASELLGLLLDGGGKFVSKEEILDRVWPDTFVEEGVLTQNIYTLRKTLGSEMIENRTRLGYRITVPVERISGTDQNRPETPLDSGSGAIPTRRGRLGFALAAIAVIVTAAGLGWYFLRPVVASFVGPREEHVKFTQLTDTGDAHSAAISPDGNFAVIARGTKLNVKDLSNGTEVELNIPDVSGFYNIMFAPDGNSFYFREQKNAFTPSRVLRTSRLGGQAVTVAEQTIGAFSVSRDQRSIAYYLADGSELNLQLVVKTIETGDVRRLFGPVFSGNFCAACAPVFSPDGSKILHINQWWGSLNGQLYVVDVATGAAEEIKLARLRRLGHAEWFPDGRSLVISASEDGRFFHLWKVDYPTGEAKALTIGLTSFSRPVMSADGKRIIAIQSNENANLFVADAKELSAQTPITVGTANRNGQMSLIWPNDEQIIFSSQIENESAENLWITNREGSTPVRITSETKFPANAPTSDGRYVFYNINRNRFANINRINLDGSDLGFLTDLSDGNRRSPQISPDGKWLYYVFFNDTGAKILRQNLETGAEETVFENEHVQCGFYLSLSPDGRHLACFNTRPDQKRADNRSTAEIAIISVDQHKAISMIRTDASRIPLRFSPDGKSVDYTVNSETGSAIFRHGFFELHPLELYRSPSDVIFNFAWSRSGDRIAISRGPQYRDAVLISGFGK